MPFAFVPAKPRALTYSAPAGALAPVYRPAGAYPQLSDWRSSQPGSAWFFGFEPNGQRVLFTQWDAGVRRFQSKLKAGLPAVIRYSEDGGCATLADPGNAQGIPRDSIAVDGIWGPTTSRVLQWALCAAGMPEAASRVQVERRLQQISRATVEDLLWLMAYVDAIGLPEAPTVTARIPRRDVQLPADALLRLPLWSTRTTSAAADRTWLGSYLPGDAGAQPPLPPSQGGSSGETPSPTVTTPGGSGGGAPDGGDTPAPPAPGEAAPMAKSTRNRLIAGALVLGGIALIAASSGPKRRKGKSRRGTTTSRTITVTRRR